MQPCKLGDGRVVLEPYSADHVAELVVAVRESVTELMPWLAWCHPAYGVRDATEWLRLCAHAAAEGINHQYAVLDARGRYAGGLGLRIFDLQNRVASVGYWIRTSAARQGLATAAVGVAAGFGFEQLGMRRLEIHAQPQNVASRRVAERAGAQFEGIARGRLLVRGVSHDSAVYALVAPGLGSR